MSAPTPELITLGNGVRVVTEPMPGAQSAVLSLRLTFGAKDDPMDRQGIARLAEDVFLQGHGRSLDDIRIDSVTLEAFPPTQQTLVTLGPKPLD